MACTKTILICCLLFFTLIGYGSVYQSFIREGAHRRAETETVPGQADEVGLWVNRREPIRSVIIGSDRSHMGALYIYDLQGRVISHSSYLNRPIGVSVRYDIPLSNGTIVDIVACGIQSTNEIKVFSINPETRVLTDITTAEGISSGFERDIYGICLYKRAGDGKLFVFVSCKTTDHLHQVLLEDDGNGKLKGTLIRKFGKKDQKKFI